ncbi:death domain-containing protein 1 [Vanacampus margaritifer]
MDDKQSREDNEEKERRRTALGVLRQLNDFHANRMSAWRDALRQCVSILNRTPPDLNSVLLSLMEDIEQIQDQLSTICNKLDAEIIHMNTEASLHSTTEQSQLPETNDDQMAIEARSERVENGGDQEQLSNTDQALVSDCVTRHDEAGGRLEVKGKGGDGEDLLDTVSEKTNKEWIKVGETDIPGACFIRAPLGAAEAVRCEVADALSCLMVTGAEELVSRVIRLKAQGDAERHFPLTLALSYRARYRGSYRTINVKAVDGERRVSYLVPATTEYGGKRGSFAEVKVYSLGLFAVISCLKQEHFTVPRRGVSYKLPVEPRICLNYLPGSFTAPVMVQYTIQPLDAVLLAAVKTKSEAYRRVVSTSPLLYLAHPSSQTLRRPLTVTLPCPPNPEKRKDTRGQVEEKELHLPQLAATPPAWDWTASHKRRMLRSCTQSSEEKPAELLSVLGSRDQQWSIPEDVLIRNHQNGLVSFELTESFDRLLVVRLFSPLQPRHLTSLAEELVESAGRHAVTVVIWRHRDEPRAVLVAALPSRELSWELSRLQAAGNGGPLQTSPEICMQEGDQLVLHLCGNVSCAGAQTNERGILDERITFHSQRKNELLLHLTEVDPFGNYSSPHYKGTVVFHKVTRGQVEWQGDTLVQMEVKHLGKPVCSLPLTLPKRVRTIRRPVTPKITLCERKDALPDSLLLWLSGELSEDEIAPLARSLRLRRSAAQLVKLRAGDSLPAQVFGILTMWRRELPASQLQSKVSQLAHCLARIGRPDLARELLLRQAEEHLPLK